jgi:virulence factor Mce-like protein
MSSARRKAVLALGTTAAAVIVVLLLSGRGGDDYYIKAALKDAGGLRKNSSVKIAGVPAGKVTDLSVTKDDVAIATLRIDKGALPIGRGATIAVRPTDLLGERYAELNPGNRGAPLPKNALIPVSRTSQPIELDDILNVLDPDTRTRLGILLNEAGTGLTGRGTDLAALLRSLPPSLDDTRALIDQISSQNVALKNVIAKGDRITQTVNGRHDDMGALIDTASGALSSVAKKRKELGSTIANAPGALSSLRTTLGRLDAASTQLRPAAVDLQRTASPLAATLKALPDFANEATPTLKTAVSVAPSLTRLGRKATPTVTRLRKTADTLNNALTPAKPVLAHMTDRGTDDLLYFISNVNRGLQGRDGVSHFIGADVNFNIETVTNAINAFNGYHPSAGNKSAKSKPAPALPKITVPKVKLPEKVDKVLPREVLKKITDKLLAPTDAAVKDATGKVADGVAGAVDAIKGALGGAQQGAGARSSGGGDALRLFDYLMGP